MKPALMTPSDVVNVPTLTEFIRQELGCAWHKDSKRTFNKFWKDLKDNFEGIGPADLIPLVAQAKRWRYHPTEAFHFLLAVERWHNGGKVFIGDLPVAKAPVSPIELELAKAIEQETDPGWLSVLSNVDGPEIREALDAWRQERS